MGWITGGATTLVERTQGITVLHEVTESGNAIVYSNAYEQVMALDGSTVVVAVSGQFSDVIEIVPAATLLIERAPTATTLQETP
jgi:hypothetical protein